MTTQHLGGIPLESLLADRVEIRLSAVADTSDRGVILASFGEDWVVWTAWLSACGTYWSLENGKYIPKNHIQDEWTSGWMRAGDIFNFRVETIIGSHAVEIVHT